MPIGGDLRLIGLQVNYHLTNKNIDTLLAFFRIGLEESVVSLGF